MKQSYKDLDVWKLSMALVEHVYTHTYHFPSHEHYGLRQQIRRAAISIPSNIAEGSGRSHSKEYVQHLSYAFGSVCELETQWLIAARLGYVDAETSDTVLNILASVGRMLKALMRALTHRKAAA